MRKAFIFVTVSLLFLLVLLFTGCASRSDCQPTAKDSTYQPERNKQDYLFKALVCKGVKNCFPLDITDYFLISDTIYLYLTWRDLQKENQVIINWYTPGGKLQDQTIHNFQYHGGTYNTWHHLQLFDNQVRHDEFIGQWTTKIILNNDYVDEKKFLVSYP